MSILTVLNARLESLTAAERQIAEFVLADPERMIHLSSVQLAELTGRSQSGVVKLCQKLGFGGYQEFKLAVSQAAAQDWSLPSGLVQGAIVSSDSFEATVQKLLGSKLLAMQQTMSLNTSAVLNQALSALSSAARIQLVGVGASSLVARDFAYKLQKLGHTVLYDADSHIQIANAALLDTDDVVFALSYSGASLETLRVAEQAQAAGASLISVTGAQVNRLASHADISLLIASDEDQARASAITSRDAQLALLDLIFILLVQKMPNAPDRIMAAQQAATQLKPK